MACCSLAPCWLYLPGRRAGRSAARPAGRPGRHAPGSAARLPARPIALGQALFFDKLLSGNRDTACATCHHPLLATGDARSLSLGTPATAAWGRCAKLCRAGCSPPQRVALFNRGVSEWAVMFWDGRVLARRGWHVRHPRRGGLPDGVESVLAAQALVPETAPAEMRDPGDLDVFGAENELALFDDTDHPAIWAALLARIVAVPGYVDLLAAAYPDVPIEQI